MDLYHVTSCYLQEDSECIESNCTELDGRVRTGRKWQVELGIMPVQDKTRSHLDTPARTRKLR